MSEVFQKQIYQSEDDGQEDGAFGVYYESLNLGDYWDTEVLTFFTYRDVTIPKGCNIISAKLSFCSANSSEAHVNLEIYADNSDTSLAPTSSADIKGRTPTSAKVSWLVQATWGQDQWYDSPNLKDIIQEIVNRDGWQSGNQITLLVQGVNNGENVSKIVYGRITSLEKSAKLIVEYEAGGTTLGLQINVAGTWKQADSVYVNVGGTWKQAEKVFTRAGGVWKQA